MLAAGSPPPPLPQDPLLLRWFDDAAGGERAAARSCTRSRRALSTLPRRSRAYFRAEATPALRGKAPRPGGRGRPRRAAARRRRCPSPRGWRTSSTAERRRRARPLQPGARAASRRAPSCGRRPPSTCWGWMRGRRRTSSCARAAAVAASRDTARARRPTIRKTRADAMGDPSSVRSCRSRPRRAPRRRSYKLWAKARERATATRGRPRSRARSSPGQVAEFRVRRLSPVTGRPAHSFFAGRRALAGHVDEATLAFLAGARRRRQRARPCRPSNASASRARAAASPRARRARPAGA